MRQSHAAQHVWRLSELDVVVGNNFYAVAPGVEKIEKRARQRFDSYISQRLADRILVVDHKSKMAPVVSRLSTAFLERQELIAQIDECRSGTLAAKLEVEQSTVKSQSLLDITNLEHGRKPRRRTRWTRAALNIAAYTLLPFGQKAVSRADYTGHDDLGTGVLGLLGNIIWLLLAGWWLALAHLITAFLLAVTVIGIPFAWAHLKLAGLALWPIGKIIVPLNSRPVAPA
jgi:uncharacterized membrane protein YccF (DUF307 family)